MLNFLKGLLSENDGTPSTNRLVVVILVLAGIYTAIIQKNLTISTMLLGFAFGNKQIGKTLENRKDSKK
jgi:hypothetical protein